ncbi:MAG: T9SS type A sorting domain-containing protein [Bacteroidales bacterium]|nr:T9SS type A sorting domain-containing protein [Bacteroidales bacterium]
MNAKKIALFLFASVMAISFAQAQSAIDDANITVTQNTSIHTTRQVLPHSMDQSYANAPLQVFLNDAEQNYQQGYWSVVGSSSNIKDLQPTAAGNIIYTPVPFPPELAEQEYKITYMAPDVQNGSSGIISLIVDDIDRYRVNGTINYTHNGEPLTLEFSIPNSAAKYIFDWDPEQPIPFYPFFSYASGTQPVEFENAMVNLGDILDPQSPADNLMKTKVQNRNTTSPFSPYWDNLDELMTNLSVDPLVQDTLYPISISIEMTDFSSDKSGNGPDPEPSNDHFKSTSSYGDISFSNPMPDATIPTNLDSTNVNGPIGWAHEYDVTVSDTTERPEIIVNGASENMGYSVEIIPTDDPHNYTAIVKMSTGSQESVEQLVMDFDAVPVGTQETPITASPPNAFPNPFTNSMSVKYNLNDAVNMKIEVYDMQGKLVKTLQDGKLGQGQHTTTWDGTNASGSEAAKGMYFIRVRNEYMGQSLKVIMK